MKFKNSSRVILRWVLSQLILESELTGPNLLCPCCSRIYFWTMALIVGILLFYWQYFLSVNIPFFYIIFALFFSLQNSSLSTGLLIPILSFYNKIIHSHGCSILFNSQIKIFSFKQFDPVLKPTPIKIGLKTFRSLHLFCSTYMG